MAFEVTVEDGLPDAVRVDEMRLRQVLRNFIANAIKFTEEGSVDVRIHRVDSDSTRWDTPQLRSASSVVAFSVTDTGIGIPKDKQTLIFEAFQQLEGGTSRKHGGTGLGLAISREIATLLGGQVKVESEPGKGSTFTLFLPSESESRVPLLEQPSPSPRAPRERPASRRPRPAAPSGLDSERRTLLVVEDDEAFAEFLVGVGREHDFHVVVASSGEEAVSLAQTLRPAAITLDISLPDADGWVILDRLKHDPATRHIPVHVISSVSEPARALASGAFASLAKPVSREALDDALERIRSFLQRRVRRLLLVEDDDTHRVAVAELIEAEDVEVVQAANAEEALSALTCGPIDCAVVDLNLPDRSGMSLLTELSKAAEKGRTPIVVYTGQTLDEGQARELRRVSDAIIVKDARSKDRLIDEVSLFLHRVECEAEGGPPSAPASDPALADKRVLVVDDDVRNAFALTALLEQYEVVVEHAENGEKAIEFLEDEACEPVDVVLMDIMMPEMDGYEATRRIRENPELRDLPIIALTAKAMRGDREKCLQAGASDYVTKPVDSRQLLSLLRVWSQR